MNDGAKRLAEDLGSTRAEGWSKPPVDSTARCYVLLRTSLVSHSKSQIVPTALTSSRLVTRRWNKCERSDTATCKSRDWKRAWKSDQGRCTSSLFNPSDLPLSFNGYQHSSDQIQGNGKDSEATKGSKGEKEAANKNQDLEGSGGHPRSGCEQRARLRADTAQ